MNLKKLILAGLKFLPEIKNHLSSLISECRQIFRVILSLNPLINPFGIKSEDIVGTPNYSRLNITYYMSHLNDFIQPAGPSRQKG